MDGSGLLRGCADDRTGGVERRLCCRQRCVYNLTGVHWTLYTITDWLGLVQLIQRKALRKVDRSILALGGFYLAVMAFYVLFEKAVVNYRPVLIEGVLEASYPSSTTMLALSIRFFRWE